jgi:hypothetical protein
MAGRQTALSLFAGGFQAWHSMNPLMSVPMARILPRLGEDSAASGRWVAAGFWVGCRVRCRRWVRFVCGLQAFSYGFAQG